MLFTFASCQNQNRETETEKAGETAPSGEPGTTETGSGVEELREKQETPTDYLTVFGRTTVQNKELKLYWTNSGFSFRFKGTGASASIATTSTNPTYWGYLNVYIDGNLEPYQTLCIKKAGTYEFASGLSDDYHTIEVRKRNEAIYGGSATLSVKNLQVQGEGFCVTPPRRPAFRIEFIGDSITCGFGNLIYDNGSAPFTTATEDGTRTYAAIAAKALHADISVIARSGICYVQDSNRDSLFGEYEKVASLPGQVLDEAKWDFSAAPNDVVVINLGTNDAGASIGGKSISSETYTTHAVNFIQMVRRNNPKAVIIWAYGMMGQGMAQSIEAAVRKVNEAGDGDVLFLKLPVLNSEKEGIGAQGHPSIQTDIDRGLFLAEFIRQEVGQEIDYSVFLKEQIIYSQYKLDETKGKYVPQSVENVKEAIEKAKAGLEGDSPDYEALRRGILDAYSGLLTAEDMSDEYVVIDTCDSKTGWQLGGINAGLDTVDQIGGSGCFTTEGNKTQNNIFFMHNPGNYNIKMPDDAENWYIEMWLYLENPDAISGGSCLEFSQKVDNIEFAWDVAGLGLKGGWNHLQLKIGNAVKTNFKDFETLQNLRFFLFLNDTTEFKVDDIVLSKGKYAANRQELDDLLKKAETIESPSLSQKNAIAFAKDATSKRMVDLAIEKLNNAGIQ